MLSKEEIEGYLTGNNEAGLQLRLRGYSPAELAFAIGELSEENAYLTFNLLPHDTAVLTFELLPLATQKTLINTLPSERAAKLLNALAPDERIAFFEGLPSPVVNNLIKLLTNDERILTLKLLGYPEHSVGRLMTPDYIAIRMDWTVQQVLDYVRHHGKDSETINFLYVVDSQGHLIDDIRIREFLLADAEKTVSEITDFKFISLNVDNDEETAIDVFTKTNRTALPVTDNNGILLGIVTMDDILYLAKEESTEDMQKIGGMQALEGPYMHTPFFDLMRKRAGWLTVLFLGEMLTASAMAFFQDEIGKAIVLTLFLPLIMSSGGNSGSQASTLIICALALGEVTVKDWWRIMKREILAGLFLGTLLGSIAFLRIFTWTLFTPIYGEHWELLATTVFLTLVGIVTWGTLSGSMLPVILKKLGFDPATSSAPFVATLIDVTGIVIYFGIAYVLLQGTLL